MLLSSRSTENKSCHSREGDLQPLQVPEHCDVVDSLKTKVVLTLPPWDRVKNAGREPGAPLANAQPSATLHSCVHPSGSFAGSSQLSIHVL